MQELKQRLRTMVAEVSAHVYREERRERRIMKRCAEVTNRYFTMMVNTPSIFDKIMPPAIAGVDPGNGCDHSGISIVKLPRKEGSDQEYRLLEDYVASSKWLQGDRPAILRGIEEDATRRRR